MKYLLAIDQSTSATKTMLFNHQAELVARVSVSHKQYYPRDGFVEHDAIEIFDNTIEGLNYKSGHIFSVQHHPESSPGPKESAYIFSQFIALMGQKA